MGALVVVSGTGFLRWAAMREFAPTQEQIEMKPRLLAIASAGAVMAIFLALVIAYLKTRVAPQEWFRTNQQAKFRGREILVLLA